MTTANQARFLQDSEVLGDSGLCQGQFADDLTAHSCLFLRQHPENANPSGMSDRLGQLRQFVIRLGTFKSLKVWRRIRLSRSAA